MVQIDVTLSAAVGATLAAAAHVQLRNEPSLWRNPYFFRAMLFTLVFVIPGLLFFLIRWPAWDTMYWFDRGEVPLLFAVGFVVLAALASALGFISGHVLARKGNIRGVFALPVVLCLPALAVIAAFPSRFLHVGTIESFKAGAPPNLHQSDLLWGLLLVIPLYIGLPLVITVARWIRPAVRNWRTAQG